MFDDVNAYFGCYTCFYELLKALETLLRNVRAVIMSILLWVIFRSVRSE